MLAGGALLARVCGRNLDQHAAGLLQLVPKHRLELVPTYVQDGPVEAALLRHIPTWLCQCATGACDHVLRSKILNRNQAIVPHQGAGGNMCQMLARFGVARLQSRDPGPGFRVTSRTPSLARHFALRTAQSCLARCHGRWQRYLRPQRQSRPRLNEAGSCHAWEIF